MVVVADMGGRESEGESESESEREREREDGRSEMGKALGGEERF